MKVSDITEAKIAEELKIEEGEYSEGSLLPFLAAAKAFVKSYTGLDDTAVDTHEDITIAVFVLIQDMHDNRSMYVEKSNLNHVVETILGMHCINLLPTPDEDVVTT